MNKTKIAIVGVIILLLTGATGYFFMQNSASNKLATSQGVESKNSNVSDVDTAGATCDKQYQNILAKYQQNFDDCRLDIKKASGCDKDPNASSAKQKNLVIIFDSSGSMAQTIDGKKKIDIAKESVNSFIQDMDKNTNLSVVLYGHKGSNSPADKKVSCAGIDEVYWMSPVKPDIAISKLSGATPTGWTPIAASLQRAGDILKNYPADKNDNMILLVSDGEETCDGDPVAKAKELMGTNLKVVTNVIGFNVTGTAEKNLQGIAGAGKGKYYSVNNANEFQKALQENKNFMAGFDCYMEQSGVWLDNGLNTEFKQADCMRRLDGDEKAEIELNTNLSDDGVTAECKDYILSTYQKRYDIIKNEIDQAYTANQKDAAVEKSNLEATKNMDAGENVFVPVK
jgi:Mg-chelatase subunit ChlD